MIDLAVVKAHLRVEHDDEDAKIKGYTDAALSAFESWTNRTLVAVGGALPDPAGRSMVITKSIEQGALLLIGHWYANAEAVLVGVTASHLPLATNSLWMPHRWSHI
jgi:hypothetical protein